MPVFIVYRPRGPRDDNGAICDECGAQIPAGTFVCDVCYTTIMTGASEDYPDLPALPPAEGPQDAICDACGASSPAARECSCGAVLCPPCYAEHAAMGL